MANSYIWTNHAFDRMKQRKIPHHFIEQVLHQPDKIIRQKDKKVELQKKVQGKFVAAIIKTTEQGEKLILSCWVNPPFPGTKDYRLRQRYFEMQKASPLRKFWLFLLTKLGL